MKKILLPEIKVGIWIDQKKAFIVRIIEEEIPSLINVESKVESRKVTPGNSAIDKRSDNAFIDDQEKKQRRQRIELKRFFKEVMYNLKDADYLYLFGPGMVKEGLKNAIEEHRNIIKGKLLDMENADRMTGIKIIQKTVAFYGTESFRVFKKNQKKHYHLV